MKTKYIVADFSNGKEIYDEIEQQLSGIPVGILGELRWNYFLIMSIVHSGLGLVARGSGYKCSYQHRLISKSPSCAIDFNYILISKIFHYQIATFLDRHAITEIATKFNSKSNSLGKQTEVHKIDEDIIISWECNFWTMELN